MQKFTSFNFYSRHTIPWLISSFYKTNKKYSAWAFAWPEGNGKTSPSTSSTRKPQENCSRALQPQAKSWRSRRRISSQNTKVCYVVSWKSDKKCRSFKKENIVDCYWTFHLKLCIFIIFFSLIIGLTSKIYSNKNLQKLMHIKNFEETSNSNRNAIILSFIFALICRRRY